MSRTNPPREVAGMHTGSATLVMIFSVICLTIFAVLSVVTARSSLTLAEKSAAAVTAYYEADCLAVKILDEVIDTYDGTFHLPTTVDAQIEQTDGGVRLHYWVPIDETQMLWVELYECDNTPCVAHWEVEVIGTWNADQSLNLWGG